VAYADSKKSQACGFSPKLTSKLTSNTMTTLPTWIDSALSFGTKRKLIVAQQLDQYFAILDFGDLSLEESAAVGGVDNYRIGAVGKTPAEAIAALDHALMEDAAADMVKAGVV
jgi:hypothetical protein